MEARRRSVLYTGSGELITDEFFADNVRVHDYIEASFAAKDVPNENQNLIKHCTNTSGSRRFELEKIHEYVYRMDGRTMLHFYVSWKDLGDKYAAVVTRVMYDSDDFLLSW